MFMLKDSTNIHKKAQNGRALDRGTSINCFNDLGLSRLGIEHPILRFRGERSKPLRHRHVLYIDSAYSL